MKKFTDEQEDLLNELASVLVEYSKGMKIFRVFEALIAFNTLAIVPQCQDKEEVDEFLENFKKVLHEAWDAIKKT